MLVPVNQNSRVSDVADIVVAFKHASTYSEQHPTTQSRHTYATATLKSRTESANFFYKRVEIFVQMLPLFCTMEASFLGGSQKEIKCVLYVILRRWILQVVVFVRYFSNGFQSIIAHVCRILKNRSGT